MVSETSNEGFSVVAPISGLNPCCSGIWFLRPLILAIFDSDDMS